MAICILTNIGMDPLGSNCSRGRFVRSSVKYTKNVVGGGGDWGVVGEGEFLDPPMVFAR